MIKAINKIHYKFFLYVYKSWFVPELANSIEITIAIDIFGTIAIGIAIAKTRFLLIDLLLLLLTRVANYCYCY